MAFICSEFSLSHYLPKVRFSDTAAACLALHPGNYWPGNLHQNKISSLWHQGRHGFQNLCAWSKPTLIHSTPLLQHYGIEDPCGWFRVASYHLKVPSHCDVLIKLQSHSNQRVMASPLLYWDKLLHQNSNPGSILQLPCSASGKDIDSQSYANASSFLHQQFLLDYLLF